MASKRVQYLIWVHLLFFFYFFTSNLEGVPHGCPSPTKLESERWGAGGPTALGTLAAATLEVSFHLFHERGAVGALEDVFPPLAAGGLAALGPTAPTTFHDGHPGGRGTRGITFLAVDHLSDDLPPARVLLLAVLPTEARLAQAVGLPSI